MGEFRKLDLGNTVESPSFIPQDKTDMRLTRKKRLYFSRRTLLIASSVLILIVLVVTFTIVLPVSAVYASAQKTYTQAKKAAAAAKTQNIALASTELTQTKKDLTDTQNKFKSLSYVGYIPIANWYYNDADHLLKAGQHSIDASIILVDAIKPYADVLGLKGQGSFVGGSAEQRIQTAVRTMGKITPKIDEISEAFIMAKEEVDAVNPNHYPSFFGGEKVKAQLTQMKLFADQGVTLIDQARPLIKVLPTLLGETKEKKYLVLFQNDKELRPTGGFITAYAIFRVDKGVIHVERSEDIYELDNKIRNKPKSPEAILKYLPKVPLFNLRDSNLSPDFVESMKTFMSMYEKASNTVAVDGVIALDTHVLVSTIKILDDSVEAGGLKFHTKLDKRCDCPQVIYELEDNISRPVGYLRSDRKGLLGQLLFAIMEKALKSSPKVYWGPLFQDMFAKMNEKHVLVYLFNKDAQSGIEAINAAGRIKQTFEGDYLHINEANLGGQKSNLFIKETVEENYEVKSDGTVTKTLTIDYKNPYPPSDCDLERGALCLNATLRDWIRVYVPKGSTLVKSVGSEVKVTSSEEFGKTVFDGFLTVRPMGVATYTLTYTLPFKLANGSPLPHLIQKQPGTNAFAYTIKLNGRKVQSFDLTTDKEIKLQP